MKYLLLTPIAFILVLLIATLDGKPAVEEQKELKTMYVMHEKGCEYVKNARSYAYKNYDRDWNDYKRSK